MPQANNERSARPRVVVIGVGNAQRGDDAVGHVVAQRLAQELGEQQTIQIVLESGEGTRLMTAWSGTEAAILIDAAIGQATPGTVHRLDAIAQPVTHSWLRCSTHAFGVAEAIELARTLQDLPRSLLVYAIEGEAFVVGTPLSQAVEGAIPEVIAQIRRDLARFAGP